VACKKISSAADDTTPVRLIGCLKIRANYRTG